MTEPHFTSTGTSGPSASYPNDDTQIQQPNIALCFARIFGTERGRLALRHLRMITIERTLGPTASDASLRHLEGQRQLVSYICALVERGRTAPNPTLYTAVGEASSHEGFHDDR